jgi:hypothetical protein
MNVTGCRAAITTAVVLLLPSSIPAQQADTACSSSAARTSITTPRVGTSAAIDTLIILDIGDRTWQRDSVNVGVALGASGTAGTRRLLWRTCVGVGAMLGHVTATLHNVRGQIHLKVDPSALDSIGRPATSPAAVPPRR